MSFGILNRPLKEVETWYYNFYRKIELFLQINFIINGAFGKKYLMDG